MMVNNFLSFFVGFLLGVLFFISNSRIKKSDFVKKKNPQNYRVMAVRNSEKNKKNDRH